jgi:hypothetical protein
MNMVFSSRFLEHLSNPWFFFSQYFNDLSNMEKPGCCRETPWMILGIWGYPITIGFFFPWITPPRESW